MSEVRNIENAIVVAAANKLVSLGVDASKLIVAGKESKSQFEKGDKILTLFKAYKRKSDLNVSEVDSLLYCLKLLSEQTSFPTVSPIVGKDATASIKLISGLKFFDEGILLGDDVAEIDFVGVGAVATKSGNRVTVTVSGGGGGGGATGSGVDQGSWDGSTNLFPVLGALGDSVKRGYTWENSNDTTSLLWIDGGIIPRGATIRALVNTPGQTPSNWRVNT